ncbi:hypothetical protein BT93_F1315 [Corymbia citriodora subsp. variegata]|nr:hypothetical protein BT93_F1315 [Corymbia citriodora subsp. variegata]
MIGTRREHPHGTVTDIFNLDCASLIAMEIGQGEEQSFTFLRAGAFVVNLYVQAITHVMMTTCTVSDLQWPLSRDSMVIRIGERSFAFVMLGLLYGLQLPPVCDEDMVDTLERVFMKFGDFSSVDDGENGYPCPDNEPTFWATVRPVVENIARGKLGNNWRLMEGNEAKSLSKVARTSAATKIVTNAILTGFLKPMHVETFVVKVVDQGRRHIDSEDAFSSISAVTNIVNSFGTVREITVGDPQIPEDAREEDGSEMTSRIKFWKLNQLGVAHFLQRNLKFLR